MTIKVRLSGEPEEIDAMVIHLREAFEVAGPNRSYPNRGSFGVRAYMEVRPRTATTTRHVHAERIQPEPKTIEP